MLDAKEKKKLKKKQRKKEKKIKQQMENENPFSGEECIEEENLYDYITTAVSNEQIASQFFEDTKRKKGKGKLSQEEIKNLSTDELLSYIENEGKRKQEEAENDENLPVQEESKSMQQIRAKAKAFVEKQQKIK